MGDPKKQQHVTMVDAFSIATSTRSLQGFANDLALEDAGSALNRHDVVVSAIVNCASAIGCPKITGENDAKSVGRRLLTGGHFAGAAKPFGK